MGSLALVLALNMFLCAPCSPSETSGCDGTTLQITDCLQREYRGVDTRLKELYQRILAGLGSPEQGGPGPHGKKARDLFIKAHKTWLIFREDECRARYSYFAEGSMREMVLLECQIELSKDRIRFLEGWLDLMER